LTAVLAWHSVQGIAVRTGPGTGTARTKVVPPGGPSPALGGALGRITAEGRVVAYPGAEVTVGTEVLGTIVSMPARENAAVRKGDLLVELRADDVRASLREAHSRLTEAEVVLRLEQARSGLNRFFPAVTGQPPQSPEARRESFIAATARR